MKIVKPEDDLPPTRPPICDTEWWHDECFGEATCDPSGYTILCLEEEYQEAFLRAYKTQDLRLCKYPVIMSEFDDSLIDGMDSTYYDNVFTYYFVLNNVFSILYI